MDPGLWEDVGSSVPGRNLGPTEELGFGSQAACSQERAALLRVTELGGMDLTCEPVLGLLCKNSLGINKS